MARRKQVFICQNCGYQSSRWLGKCSDCEAWNSFVEEEITSNGKQSAPAKVSKPQLLSGVPTEDVSKRVLTGSGEFDRVLGGGIFPASVVLLAGEPGIGKSTLLLQMMLWLRHKQHKVLYVSGEESLQQIKNRSDRLRLRQKELLVLAETNVNTIESCIEDEKPAVVVVDSIQAIYNPDFSGAPGNVGQVRECAARLFQMAKESGFTLFLVGHVTKEGSVAGPKILEHLVDVVVYFEGNTQQHRIVRAIKNRFGAANEIGVFEMHHDGLREVIDVSHLFITPHQGPVVGSCVVCSYEGSRPLLVEVQTLVGRTNYGTPQRTVSGFDQRRLSLILAILEKYCRVDFGAFDVFVKVAGGLRLNDPGIDLGVAAALYSSLQNQPLATDGIYIGEVGLSGEVRSVSFVEQRIKEAQKMGFKQVFLSHKNMPEPADRKNYKVMLSPIEFVSELLLPVR